MTRVEGICACENIVSLIETLLDHLNENSREKFQNFGESVAQKVTNIQTTLEENSRWANASDDQERALRNMWRGVKGWDRKNEFNEDLFDDLSQVVARLKKSDAEEGVVTSAPEEDLESDEMLDEEQKALLEKLSTRETTLNANAKSAISHAEDAAKLAKELIEKFSPATFSKAKSAAISTVLRQFAEQHIKVVDRDAVNSGILDYIVGKTSSIRTQELIKAAYFSGKVAGVKLLYSELVELLDLLIEQ